VSFPHLALIFLVALIVLGPQKMPKLVAQVGRWAGKARAMARQFREQLETEINLEELNRNASTRTPPPDQFNPPYGQDAASAPADSSTATADAAVTPTDPVHPAATQQATVAETAPFADAGPGAHVEAPVATTWAPDVHDGSQHEPAAPETVSPTPMAGNHERV
jgi:sec-independent protein translocase protein TatB